MSSSFEEEDVPYPPGTQDYDDMVYSIAEILAERHNVHPENMIGRARRIVDSINYGHHMDGT